MSTTCDLPSGVIEQVRRNPAPAVVRDLGQAAREMSLHTTVEFRKLMAYVLELADGRDRREPWTTRPGIARPVPRLRIALDRCFGQYADLQWFRLNKTTNTSGMPLVGMFPRIAATLARVTPEDFGAIVEALVAEAPDPAVMRLLHKRSGKIKGVGVELFSRIASAFRRDLYFVISRGWGDSTGILKYLDGDLRKYCALCRTLRAVSDELGLPEDIRSSVFDRLMESGAPPAPLNEALHRALGPALAHFKVLDPQDAYSGAVHGDEQASMPLEFAASAIRARRGDRRLRSMLLQVFGSKCAITGACPTDLLEVAYVVPFPDGDVHTVTNAILMRSDLHTLWDLNLIGIDPDGLAIHVSPRLAGSVYESVAGRRLTERPGAPRLARDGIRERWSAFTAGAAATARKPAGRGEPARRPGSDDGPPVPEIEVKPQARAAPR